MKKRNGLIKTSLACALIFGGVGLLAGCGKEDPKVTIHDIYVTGDYAETTKEFVIGSDVSLAGAKVEVSFSDGTKQTVTITDEMWKKSDYDFTTLGEKTITVKFKVNGEEKSEPITIKIVNPLSVQQVIDEITNFTINPPFDRWMEETVDSIKTSYNALSDTDKGLVTNYNDFFTAYKAVKKDVILNYVEITDYEENDRALVTGFIEAASTNIDSATTFDEVDNALQTAKTNINDIETTLQIRINIVLEAFDTYVTEKFDEEDYSPLKWVALQTAIQTIRSDIENATNVISLPDVTNGYYNHELMQIDNLTTENIKNRINELPSASEINTYNATLMNEVKSILNTYENILTSEERNRIDSELIEGVEEVEVALGTLDLENYKASKIELINEFLDRESEYSYQEWQNIVSLIENTISTINDYTYDEDAKSYVDDAYEDLMDSLYDVATTEVNNLYALLSGIPNKIYVASNSVIFNDYGAYNIFNNKFFISDQMFEIEGNQVVGEYGSYDIADGMVEIEGITYTILNDVKSLISELEEEYNKLDENEKAHYKAGQVSQTVSDFKNDIYNRMDYLETKVETLQEYLDEDKYNVNRLDQINSIIEEFKYRNISEYSLESYKESIDDYYEYAVSRIGAVYNKLDDICVILRDSIVYNNGDYYQEQLEQIMEIVNNADAEGQAVQPGPNETIEEAVARVQAIIDAANEEVAKVKTYKEINTDYVNDEILPQLEVYIQSIKHEGFTNVPTDEEVTDPACQKPLSVVYQTIKTNMLSEAVIGMKDETFEELLTNYEKQKIINIDYIGRTYTKSVDSFTIQSKLREYVTNPSDSNIYINLGPVRESLKGGYNYTTDYEWRWSSRPTSAYNKVNVNGIEYEYGEHYKVVNGYLYASLTALSYATEDELQIKISFGSLKDGNGETIYDTYNIVLDNQIAENGAFSSVSATDESVGKTNPEDTKAGYVEGSQNTLTTYKYGADLELVYKDGENDIAGPVIVKLDEIKDIQYRVNTVYYIYVLDGVNKTMTLPMVLGEDKDRFVTEVEFGGHYAVSVSSSAGIDVDEVKFYVDKETNVEALKPQYKADIDAYVDLENYDENTRIELEAVIANYKNKIDNATSAQALQNIWSNESVKGSISETTVIIGGDEYTINENKLYYKGKEAGSINGSTITLNEKTWTFVGDAIYWLDEDLVDIYLSHIVDNEIEIHNSDHTIYAEYTIDGSKLMLGSSEIGTVDVSFEGGNLTEGSSITFFSKSYTIDGSNVVDEEFLGFKNIIDRDYAKAVEFVAPTITINDNDLIVKEDHNEQKYYEYKLSKGETQLVLKSTDFDSVNFYAKVWEDYSSEMVDMSFPYTIQDASNMYSIEITYYRKSDNCEVGYQRIYIVDYVPIASVKVNNVNVENSIDGYYIDMDRMGATNTLQITVEEGYEYFISDGDNTVDLDNLYLEIGYNSYGVMIRNKENDSEMYFVIVTINVADDLNDITFGGIEASNSGGEYDVYGMEPATELDIEYTGGETDIASIDVVDANGDSILNGSGKIDMTNIPILRARLKVTIDSIVYYKNIVLLNVDEGEGSEYETNSENGQEFIGLESSIKFTYKVNDDLSIPIAYDSNYDSQMSIWATSSNQKQVQVRLGTLVVPKGFDINNILVEKGTAYTGTATIELEKVTSVSNMLKLVIKKDGYVNGVVYFLLEEDEYAIDNNCDIYAGDIGLREYYELMGSVSSPEETIAAIKGQSVSVSEDTTITSESDHYLEGVSKYYRANLTVDAGDFFFVLAKNKFQQVSVSSGNILEYDDYDQSYTFTNLFETGDVIIVDVESADQTTKYRYIYTLTKVDAMLGVEVVIDNDTKINLELRNGGAAGDFMDVSEDSVPLMVTFVGTQNLNNKVSVKFSASQEALATGAITLTPQYDENDVLDISKQQELSVTNIELQEGTAPAILFYSHTVINGESVMVIPFAIIFSEMPSDY